MRMKRKAKVTPLCQTSKGCPIHEMASNAEINILCTRYISARSTAENTGATVLLNKFYEMYGFTEHIELALQLENVWADYINLERERQRQKTIK